MIITKMILREYQQFLVYKIKCEINNGKRSICCVLGCGGGKSVIQGNIAASANAKGNRVLFLVHRKELCEQIRDTFTKCGVDWNLTTVGMVQTISRHVLSVETPDIIITDECHLSTAKTYTKIYTLFPNALKLGFTATPCRLNEGGLGNVYDALVEGVSTRWLIDNGHLADYKHYSLPLADTSGLHVRAGEFRQEEIMELMERKDVYGKTVETWKRLAEGKKTIVYCSSVESSKETAQLFNENGVTAAHLDGGTRAEDRTEIMKQFRAGQITVLCNCELFSVGLDVPDCECVVLLRPTQSLTLYIQQAMRCMRADKNNPDKVGIIIDHVGNIFRHGFVDDNRNWTLDAKKRKEENTVKIKECPSCFAVYSADKARCPNCGFECHIVKQTTGKKKTVDIDLKEVKRIEDIKNADYSEYQKCQTFSELVEFQKVRKYKFAWVLRKAKELGIEIPKKYRYNMRYIS
ncbi:MAG: DEAD/DEAH box helicase [Oscillospiraceae bacterium]|nr:DEAD/DEAH box helicase [Oscillospiraceae bacterium]